MPRSTHRLFKNSSEFLPKSKVPEVPPYKRGIYVLFEEVPKIGMRVVYLGMARGEKSGIRGRLNSHLKHKSNLWTHFSVFEAWDNISVQEIEELEGFFRQIYRRDAKAIQLNKQRSHEPLRKIHRASFDDWV